MKNLLQSLFVLTALLLNPLLVISQCATGYASDAGVQGVNNTGVWTQEGNTVGAPDGSGASILTFVPLEPGRSSSMLSMWDFGLNVPCNAVIDDVTFHVTRRNNSATGNVVDENINLRYGNFILAPANAAAATPWLNSTTGWETYSYTAASNWGATLTPDLVNDLRVAMIMTVVNNSTTEDGNPEVDAIEIEVCYTLPGPALPPLEAEISSTADNLCDPAGNGTITVTATGGTGTYEYSIDNGANWQPTNVFSGLASDNYQVIVRDTDMSCMTIVGTRYIGCSDTSIMQVGDAIYTCNPSGDAVTLAIDRIQPLNDLYNGGFVNQDVSEQLQTQAFSWTTGQLGGEVYSVALDESNNIYTGVSSLFNLISPVAAANLIAIDGVTGVPTVIGTLPGEAGVGQIEYQQSCTQLFAANLDDGIIYRYSTTGTLLSTFDPLGADDGILGLAPLGERIGGLAFNNADNRLYYSIWANDLINNGQRNTVRSIQIDPITCDFVPGSDMEEISIPYISELESGGIAASMDYSMPVLDIEFNDAGTIMLLAEAGYNSVVPVIQAHQARLLRYDGATTAWTNNNTLPAGNGTFIYEIGTLSNGKNSLGGVDFGYAGIDGGGCVGADESFVVSIGDALKGANCSVEGCLYGIQYFPVTGGRSETSVLVDLARAPTSQQKGFFGDVDVIGGCCPCACPVISSDVTTTDNDLCQSDMVTLCSDSESGGTAPYTYQWGNAETTQCIDVSPTMSTTYDVTITDANGCTTDNSITINVSSPMTIDDLSVVDNSNCNGGNGSIAATVSGGTAPLTYSFDGGMTFDMNSSAADLTGGTYNVVIRDAFGCEVTSAADVNGVGSVSVMNVATVDDTDCVANNGSITITANGGTAPLSYSIDGGITFSPSNVFASLGAGTYDIVVEDDLGCTGANTATLNGPAMFTSSLSTVDNSSCSQPNGSITLTITGGVAPYSYSVDGGLTFSTDNTFTDLTEGTYAIVMEDDNGCSESVSITLAGPAAFTLSTNVTDDTDCDLDNGSITLVPSGGTAPYTYSIDGGLTYGSDDLYSLLSPGNYSVAVQDAAGCEATAQATIQDNGICNGAVGNFVWDDFNGNGVQDPGEPGIPGLRVELYNRQGNLVQVQLSDNSGNYLFDNVPDGDYFIRFDGVEEEGYTSTFPNASGNNETDSDVDNSNGPFTTPVFSVGSGITDLSVDYGLYTCIPLGELVWFDIDEDGIKDDNENGINGLKVELFKRVANFWIKTDITYTGHKPGTGSDDGYFKFCVAPGQYYLKYDNPPNRLVRTLANRGVDETKDSDVTDRFESGTTDDFTVFSGEEKCDVGAGFVPAGTIGDFVFVDNNRNGLRDLNDGGLESVMVQAVNAEGVMVAHAVTDSEGRYELDMLPYNDYYVQFILPEDYMMTTPNEGSDESIDSDADGSNGPNTTPVYTVRPGQYISVGAGVVNAGLPVTWVGIDGEAKDGYNVITWQVASEINVSHYEVEYSKSSEFDYESFESKPSAFGTYQGLLTYQVQHDRMTPGINYYRVKQVDLDGRFEYSETVSINNQETTATEQIKIYPNPAMNELNIGLTLSEVTSEIQVNLHDNLGRLIYDNLIYDLDVERGYKLYNLDVTDLANGVYTLEIVIDNNVIVKKIAITE